MASLVLLVLCTSTLFVCGNAEDADDVCSLPILPGPCRASKPRVGFNAATQECVRFIYGGCKSNGNNFLSLEACRNKCIGSVDVHDESYNAFPVNDSKPSPTRRPTKRSTTPSGLSISATQVTKPPKITRASRVTDMDSLPRTKRPKTSIDATSFTTEKRSATQSSSSLITRATSSLNIVNRRARTEAEITFPVTSTTPTMFPSTTIGNPCFQMSDVGPCKGNLQRFSYNATSDTCDIFIYGGCEGNANRFRSIEQCQRACSPFKRPDRCTLTPEPGLCRAKHRKFAFDVNSNSCKPFNFGGCGGNLNRFDTLEECHLKCVGTEMVTSKRMHKHTAKLASP